MLNLQFERKYHFDILIRSNRNRLEIEMCELILDIMDSTGTDTFSFCYNDILLLLVHSQVKVEKHLWYKSPSGRKRKPRSR